MGKVAKAESKSGVTSQPPSRATSTQQRSGRVTKAENGGRATSKPPKVGQVADNRADLVAQRTACKTELPHVAGQEAAHRSAAELQYSYILMKKQQF
jgi:hypothetical protein